MITSHGSTIKLKYVCVVVKMKHFEPEEQFLIFLRFATAERSLAQENQQQRVEVGVWSRAAL